jgi:hypothetical protein
VLARREKPAPNAFTTEFRCLACREPDADGVDFDNRKTARPAATPRAGSDTRAAIRHQHSQEKPLAIRRTTRTIAVGAVLAAALAACASSMPSTSGPSLSSAGAPT